RDDTDDDELEDQELEAHYKYMTQLQEVSPDAADSGPIFDDEPLKKQSKSVHDTYPIDQDAQIMNIDSLDMNYDREEIAQNDDDNDLAKDRGLYIPSATSTADVAATWTCGTQSADVALSRELIWDLHVDVAADVAVTWHTYCAGGAWTNERVTRGYEVLCRCTRSGSETKMEEDLKNL
nr:hypothetical protein [Tanacetum cinerariifolium]